MPSSPPPDRFQREIDDIIRLAERRLEHQSFRYRMRRSTRRLGNAFGGFAIKLPNAGKLGGWGLVLRLGSGVAAAELAVQPALHQLHVLDQAAAAVGLDLRRAAADPRTCELFAT